MANLKLPIRILPMSSDEPDFRGKTAGEVQQQFFMKMLPSKEGPGNYYFRKSGLNARPGTVVLFQYENQIIASATLFHVERFSRPKGEYSGAFDFDISSIRVFDPVGPDQIKNIWPKDFKRFGNAKPSLPAAAYPLFVQQLKNVNALPGKPPEAFDLAAPPASRVQTIISRIVRDTQLANRIKAMHNYECQICGHTIILADGSRYAEGHHVQPLGKPHNGPDAIENIVCLCPNHHAACDLGN